MIELDECLRAKRKIAEIEEKIEALKAVILAPKNQVITGMPRGGNSLDNSIDRYMVRLEVLESQKKRMVDYHLKNWVAFVEKAEQAGISDQEKHLMFLRFGYGYPWSKCLDVMQSLYGDWNINKVFRVYRRILKMVG